MRFILGGVSAEELVQQIGVGACYFLITSTMKPVIWLRSGARTWLAVAKDDRGTLDISRIAAFTGLRSETLALGQAPGGPVQAYEGITIAVLKQVCGSREGESRASAVIVEGIAAAHILELLSVKTWLEQVLQRPDFEFGSRPPSVNRRRRLWPMGFSQWGGLSSQAHEFYISQDSRNRIHRPIAIPFAFSGPNEASSSAVLQNLLVQLLRVMFARGDVGIVQEDVLHVQLPPEVRSSGGGHGHAQAIFHAQLTVDTLKKDIGVVDRSNKTFFIIEVKKCSLFRTSATDAILRLYEVDNFLRGGQARGGCIVEAVGQIYTYMVAKGLGYGALSSGDVTWFLKRTRENGLLISDGVLWEDPMYLRMLAYVIHLGKTDTVKYPMKPTRYINDSSSPSPGLASAFWCSNPSNTVGLGYSTGERRPSSRLTRRAYSDDSGRRFHQKPMRDEFLEEIDADELHLEDEPFAIGWSGHVVKGFYRNIPIAVKLAPLHSERGVALQNEAHAYLELEEVWGIYVPTLVRWGTTANRKVIFIATRFMEGYELETRSIPQTVAMGAIDALRAVHALGILHGDIRGSNFMVCLNGGVVLLDFGFSRRSTRESDFALEMKELQKLLGWKKQRWSSGGTYTRRMSMDCGRGSVDMF